MTHRYTVGYSSERRLRAAAEDHGASEAELCAIARLGAFTATEVDVRRLLPLAELVGIELPKIATEENEMIEPGSPFALWLSGLPDWMGAHGPRERLAPSSTDRFGLKVGP